MKPGIIDLEPTQGEQEEERLTLEMWDEWFQDTESGNESEIESD